MVEILMIAAFAWVFGSLFISGRQRLTLLENNCHHEHPNFWHNIDAFKEVSLERHIWHVMTLRDPGKLYRFRPAR